MHEDDLQRYIKNLERIVIKKQKSIEKMQGRFKKGILSRCLALSLVDPVLLLQRQISAISEILEQETGAQRGELPQSARDKITTILARITESSSIISQLMDNLKGPDWIRPRQGEELNINLVITKWVEQVKFHPCYHPVIKINLFLNQYLPATVMRFSETFQIIHSLGINALEAVDKKKDGQISIRTDMTDRFILLEITDNGRGINPEVREDVFKPFYSTKDPEDSDCYHPGLGLYIASRLVEEMGGNIMLDCGSRGKTAFKVFLPIHTVKELGDDELS